MKKYLVTFGDLRMHRSLNRFRKQAIALDFYDSIYSFDESGLEKDFIDRFKEQLIPGSRGYGYWCWKPQIILQVLRKMQMGDILQYTDVGCHLNPKGRERLKDYFEITDNSPMGILAFQAKFPEAPLKYDGRTLFNQRDYMFVKGDLIDYFGVRDSPEITNSYSIGATVFFIKKTKKSVDFVEEWLGIVKKSFTYIDNSPSISPNFEGFIEHRHDQAIFSMLAKKYHLPTLSTYEYYFPKNNSIYPDWKILRQFPIHAKRDKDLGFFKNLKVLYKRVINKAKKIFYEM
uniref:hypothetical protein n=1 Tax=Bacteroidota TaxID=976 RepID=UPI004047F82C